MTARAASIPMVRLQAPPPEEPWDPSDEDAPDAPPRSRTGSDTRAAVESPTASVFEQRWTRLSDRAGFLTEQPPPTQWALTRWHNGRDVGVLPRGKTGLLAATGGVGKTYALIQLALAFATSNLADEDPLATAHQAGFWLGTFRAAPNGHVLLALAEEDMEESQRRLWRAANALELSDVERREAEKRIHLLPLHGVPVALTAAEGPGQIIETDITRELRRKIESFDVEWSMLIFDPLSRWAGGGVESNNELATRFCQIVERFTELRGQPCVLVAHHSAKGAAQTGTANARGVSGIRDGFRWMATMDTVVDAGTGRKGILLRNDKSNYSVAFDDMTLVRSEEPGSEGTLRRASEAEAAGFAQSGSREAAAKEREAAKQAATAAEIESTISAILAVIPDSPETCTSSDIDRRLRERGVKLGEKRRTGLLETLEGEGRIRDVSSRRQSTGRRWCRAE